MKFLKSLNKTLHDIKGENSLLVHGLVGCNLNCFSCHNKEELICKKHEDFISEDDLLKTIESNGYFFDNIIFSGGEITLEYKNLKSLIIKIKEIYDGKIIIYTNGTIPKAITELSDIVDGFHMDLKYNINNDDTFNICGVNTDSNDIRRSLDIIYSVNKGFSQIRTVKYPQYDDEYLHELIIFMRDNYPNVEYKQNEFYEN